MRRRAGFAGAIVILTTAALLTGPGAAFAKTPAATVERATVTTPINEPADACGAPATMVGDDVLSYQSVQTDQGFHFAGTDRVAFVLTAADGTYAVGGSTDHLALDAVAGGVRTDTHHDWAAFYAADGQLLSEGQFRSVEHYTVTPDGALRVEFERIVVDEFPC